MKMIIGIFDGILTAMILINLVNSINDNGFNLSIGWIVSFILMVRIVLSKMHVSQHTDSQPD